MTQFLIIAIQSTHDKFRENIYMKNLSRFCDLKGKFSPKDKFVPRLLQDIGTESKTSNT